MAVFLAFRCGVLSRIYSCREKLARLCCWAGLVLGVLAGCPTAMAFSGLYCHSSLSPLSLPALRPPLSPIAFLSHSVPS